MRKLLACYLVIVIFVIGMVPRADAAFSPSDLLTLSPSTRAGDAEKIRTVLENKLVRQRLQDLGYSTDEIAGRLAELSDQEVHSIAQKLDDLRVGSDGLGFVIAILIIVVLVLLIIHLTGHRVLVK
ncbi:MAG TPA: PA2779 family protein [Syntrophorhabdales bacterium]|nr:PA2779 family protein [Syntrophorhabdales bacterium]